MTAPESPKLEPLDATGQVFRALTLYALAEHQGGHATRLNLSARGRSFSVADNGRGHALDRSVEGVPYLSFIYRHLEYPFAASRGGDVQLQGLGMSLLNRLCAELHLVVRRPQETLHLGFRGGRACEERRVAESNEECGNTVSGELRSELQPQPTDEAALEAWLGQVLRANPGLALSFNGKLLAALSGGAP